jgi:uncharacterized protein YdbL (DUF1318 family)
MTAHILNAYRTADGYLVEIRDDAYGRPIVADIETPFGWSAMELFERREDADAWVTRTLDEIRNGAY